MQNMLAIFKIVMSAATILTGLVSLVKPKAIFGFTGLRVEGGRGMTEIRAFLGGALIGAGVVPLILGSADAYQVLGGLYLAAAIARLAGMFIDQSINRSNLISLGFEVMAGVVLVLP